MKPIFGTDITDKNNEKWNGEIFVTVKPPEELQKKMEEQSEAFSEAVKATELPLWLSITKTILGAFGIMVVIIFAANGLENGFEKTFSNAPALVISGVLALVIWAVIFVYSKLKSKKALEENDIEIHSSDIDRTAAEILAAMNVPDYATDTDIIGFSYKVKNGEIVPKIVVGVSTGYLMVPEKVYDDGDALCIADLENVYSFKKEWLKRIITVNKRTRIIGWNKDEECTSEKYAEFNIKNEDGIVVTMDRHYILEVEKDGESYGIYFPSHELAVFERYSGLRAE